MVSKYRRGWEDALDVVLELRDWDKVEEIRTKLERIKLMSLIRGPF